MAKRNRPVKPEPEPAEQVQPGPEAIEVEDEQVTVSVEDAIADQSKARVAEHRQVRGQRVHGDHHQHHKSRK